jgi:hypothetical protein
MSEKTKVFPTGEEKYKQIFLLKWKCITLEASLAQKVVHS